MSKIHVLDQNTINQIAAGEVIDRPASIVKELMENAIDAGATMISVEIKDGGTSLIRITDNGSGIEKDDIKVAFLRHATSKIKTALDLISVSSLGFRGEALSSIASVCQVELITKTEDAITGIRYKIEGGKEVTFEEIGAPEGTTFIVKNIFFNTPARRKFLKTAQTEAGYISEIVEKIALSHPEISISFINNNQTKIHTSGNGNLKDVIYNIFGRDVAMNLLPVKGNENGILVDGYIGKPVISRGNRNYENYFVNGRYLKNNIISKAIEEGYKGHAMVHKFPFTALMISMDPHSFDANVHPAKMEMRFRNAEELYSSVMSAVRSSFVKKELIPKVGLGNEQKVKENARKIPEPFEKKRRAIEERFSSLSSEQIKQIAKKKENNESKIKDSFSKAEGGVQNAALNPNGLGCVQDEDVSEISNRRSSIEERIARLHVGENTAIQKEIDKVIPKTMEKNSIDSEKTENNTEINTGQPQSQQPVQVEKTKAELVKETDNYAKGTQMSFADVPLLSEEARPKHRIIGQVFRTYWLVEYDEKLFFVDQHAAHEKVMYEKLKKDLENNTIVQQMVAPPIILTFSIKEQQKFELCEESFKKLGFLIEEFGGNEYCIRGVPANLLGIDPQELFIEIFDQIEENSGKMNMEMITDKLASMACKAAVKGNTTMSYEEMDSLMEQLMKLDNPYQCPHGRPTIISMTKYELEKKFKRVQ